MKGKIIGAAIGAIGGPVGALFGGLVGHLFDRAGGEEGAATLESEELSNLVPGSVARRLYGVAGLAALAYQANGRPELAGAQRVFAARMQSQFGFAERFRPYAQRTFSRLTDADGELPLADLVAICRAVLASTQRRPLLVLLFDVADVRGRGLQPATAELTRFVADQLGVARADYLAVRDRAVGSEAGAYRTLGLSIGASVAEIKHAYRTLASRHHPDHAGADGAASDSAQRFRSIQKAFETIRRARGF